MAMVMVISENQVNFCISNFFIFLMILILGNPFSLLEFPHFLLVSCFVLFFLLTIQYNYTSGIQKVNLDLHFHFARIIL